MAQQTQTVGYVRVSSVDQNEARQLERIGEVDRLFVEKVSGASRTHRTALADCLGYVRQGDVVLVASMDRLARSLRDLRGIVDEFHVKGATVRFLKEGQTYIPDATDAQAQLMLNLLGSFAEFERALIRERQAEGIAIAKAAGKYQGRAKKLKVPELEDARRLIAVGVPKAQVARQLGVNRSTLYRALAPDPDTRPAQPVAPAP